MSRHLLDTADEGTPRDVIRMIETITGVMVPFAPRGYAGRHRQEMADPWADPAMQPTEWRDELDLLRGCDR